MDRLNRKVNVRVAPTIGRPDLFNLIKDKDDGLVHFWVLPQHASLFDKYIDVFDILDPEIIREETLVRLYVKGIYNRELKYFIRNGESDMPGHLVDEALMDRRLDCHQICLQGQDRSKCHFCYMENALYKQLMKEQQRPNDSDDELEILEKK